MPCRHFIFLFFYDKMPLFIDFHIYLRHCLFSPLRFTLRRFAAFRCCRHFFAAMFHFHAYCHNMLMLPLSLIFFIFSSLDAFFFFADWYATHDYFMPFIAIIFIWLLLFIIDAIDADAAVYMLIIFAFIWYAMIFASYAWYCWCFRLFSLISCQRSFDYIIFA